MTGATGGIGVEILRALVQAGAQVAIGCREVGKGEAVVASLGARAVEQVRVTPLDLASLASVREAVRWAAGELPQLDVLLNHAGVWSRQRRTTADGFELTFGVNHLAHQALTMGLVPMLRRATAPRVITTTSGLHVRAKLAWDDLMQTKGGFNGVKAYEQSKLANVMFALALARRMKGAVASNAVHPGIVKTNLTREYPEMYRDMAPRALLAPAVAARSVVRLATDAGLATVSGRYFDRDREQAPSKLAQSIADQDRLWRVTEELIASVRSP